MASLWWAASSAFSSEKPPLDYDGMEFWSDPERTGWLTKQGEYIKTWRRRWFVLKQGKLFWFKDSVVSRSSCPRGIIPATSWILCSAWWSASHRSSALLGVVLDVAPAMVLLGSHFAALSTESFLRAWRLSRNSALPWTGCNPALLPALAPVLLLAFRSSFAFEPYSGLELALHCKIIEQ